MGAEVEHHLLVAPAEHPRVGERRKTGADLDGPAAGVVENAVVEGPSVDVPHPAGERAVDEGGPEEDEDHGREHAAALRDGADHKGCRDSAEHHLQLHKHTISQHIRHIVTPQDLLSLFFFQVEKEKR